MYTRASRWETDALAWVQRGIIVTGFDVGNGGLAGSLAASRPTIGSCGFFTPAAHPTQGVRAHAVVRIGILRVLLIAYSGIMQTIVEPAPHPLMLCESFQSARVPRE
jgi:hypothetical protein